VLHALGAERLILPRNVSTIVRQPGREIKLSSFGPWPVG